MTSRVRAALAVTLNPARARTVLDHGAALSFRSPAAGRVAITWTIRDRSGSHRRLGIAIASTYVRAGRGVRLKLALSNATKRALARAHRVEIVAQTSFTLTGGARVTVSRGMLVSL